MNRRDFLRRAGMAIAAMGIDPERLIWQPRQLVSVPAMPARRMWDPGSGPSRTAWVIAFPKDNGVQFDIIPIEPGAIMEVGSYVGDGRAVREVKLGEWMDLGTERASTWLKVREMPAQRMRVLDVRR